MELNSTNLRNIATQVRLAVRYRTPDAQLNALNAVFKAVYPDGVHMTPHISGIGRTGQEFVSESLLFGQHGKHVGRFRLYILNDANQTVHKLTAKLGGTKYVLNFPSTTNSNKMERFVSNVCRALVGLWATH